MAVNPETIGTPISARPKNDPRKIDGVAGDEKLHSLLDSAKSLYDITLDEAGGKPAIKAKEPTVGTQQFDKAKNAVDFVKKFDPKNAAGSIPFALNLATMVQKGLNPQDFVKDLLGSKITGLLGQLTQVTNLLQQAQNLLPAQVQQLMQMEQQLTGVLNSELSSAVGKIQQVTDTATQITNLANNVKNTIEQP
jgi:hypothetical protein